VVFLVLLNARLSQSGFESNNSKEDWMRQETWAVNQVIIKKEKDEEEERTRVN
jgi:3-deoxy-D-manno-octulosonic-acid transferase